MTRPLFLNSLLLAGTFTLTRQRNLLRYFLNGHCNTPFHRGYRDSCSIVILFFHCIIETAFVEVFPKGITEQLCPVSTASPAFLNETAVTL